MKTNTLLIGLILTIMATSCTDESPEITVYETSESGNKLTQVTDFKALENPTSITLDTSKEFQTISGFGGAFTESSAYLLNQVSKENRDKILKAYFAKEGARYSLARTHMNSCDFSLNNLSLIHI